MVLGAVLCPALTAPAAPLFCTGAAGKGASASVFQAPQAAQRPAHFKVSFPHSVQ
jgi:hypothetical protein